MTTFDSSSIWRELQAEEDNLKSIFQNSKNENRSTTQTWRLRPMPRKGKHHKPNQQRKRMRSPYWAKSRIPDQNPPKPPRFAKKRTTGTPGIRKQQKPRSIKHAINLLNGSNDKQTRLWSLQFMDSFLSTTKQNLSNTPPGLYKQEDIMMKILKCITKTFVDPQEPVRSLSIAVVHHHIGSVPAKWDYETSVQYVIPVIAHCILGNAQNGGYYENSEEIRLKMVELLDRIVRLSRKENELTPICGEIIQISMKLLSDPHFMINKDVCYLLVNLSEKIRLDSVAALLIDSALPLLSHRRSHVRVSAIHLVECMLMNGGHEAIQKLTGFREHNVVPLEWWFGGEVRANYFGALCRHSNAAVRTAFYRMIFNVMTNMQQRYDYKTLLLSYVLSGLQDEDTRIQMTTFDAIERIGALHEQDDYNDLKRTLFFQKQAEEIRKEYLGNDDAEFQLPHPFRHRPCLGSRILIREHFNRIVHAALEELKDWKKQCREMAILLIRNMLIYSEEYCSQNAEVLLLALRRLISDKNAHKGSIAEIAKECVSLIGKFVYPMIWLDCIWDLIQHEPDAHLVEMLRQLIKGSPMRSLRKFVPRIVSIMEFMTLGMTHSERKQANDAVADILMILSCVNHLNAEKEDEADGDSKNEVNGDEFEFEFSSEYLGFQLQIVDETEKTVSGAVTEDGGDQSAAVLYGKRIERLIEMNGKCVQ